ncbi:hypothetical protein WMF37_34370 [Sorangium sp. So ce291]|uniref:hypothetical protein n=1 Tax=Sorangium sp. So ce291 TaxID=3133294 RepID=UPI003F6409D2
MMVNERACPRCQVAIERDAPLGLCPRCLIGRVVGRPTPPADFDPPGQPDIPLPSLRLGAYEILDRLGAGGMGVVYRARQVRADEAVALDADPRLRLISWSGVVLALLGLAFAAASAARRRHRRVADER